MGLQERRLIMARQTKPLIDMEIKAAKPKDADYQLYDGDGLTLLIKYSWSKLWQFRDYHPFTRQRINQSFGTYPPVILSDARKRRAESRALLAKQIDPLEHQKEQLRSSQEAKTNTFKLIAERWENVKKTSLTENYAEDIWRSLERNFFPVIGEICITDIEAHALLKAIQPVQASALMRWWYTPKIPGLLTLFRALISVRPLRKLKRRICQLYENKCFYEKDDGVQDNVYPFTPRHYYQFWIAW